MAKTLIAYFSHAGQNYSHGSIRNLEVGNTEVVARKIHALIDSDLFYIDTVQKYPDDHMQKIEIAKKEYNEDARPELTQKELRKTLDKYGIKLMAWYPLGHGDKSLIQEPVFAELGKKYGKSPAQVILRWHTQMGFVVIPGSKNVDHIKDNLDILDFTLTDEEMAEIAKLDKDERYYHRTDEQLVQFAGWRPQFER